MSRLFFAIASFAVMLTVAKAETEVPVLSEGPVLVADCGPLPPPCPPCPPNE